MRISNKSRKRAQTFLISILSILLAAGGIKLLLDKSWFLGILTLISALLCARVYMSEKHIPGKYLLPGVILLIFFHIYPALYSGQVAFTNDSNGHQLTKSQAIEAIIEDSRISIENQKPSRYFAATQKLTGEIFAVFEYSDKGFWAGNSDTVYPLYKSDLRIDLNGDISSVKEFEIISPTKYSEISDLLQAMQIRLPSQEVLIPSDFEYLEAFAPGLVYIPEVDEIHEISTAITYRPNDNGQMVSATGEILYPGWKANVGFRNFSSIVTNPEVRRPLLAVLAWTFVNAFISVVLAFLMGLILALVFNFPALKSKRIYRTIFITPLAIPSVLSVLVWAGLFQTSNGVVNRLFHSEIPWLTDASWARIAILIVELWISFPYMFLITTGAIQAIPGEIIEAAEIDGASPFKSFTLIKLPLVLRTVAPLLIASGAMALNNFGVIYLLTGGGPTFNNSNGNAGATDILISYTYKLAFNGQEGNNYGLASALSIINFVLVGIMSIYGLKRIKTMEGIN